MTAAFLLSIVLGFVWVKSLRATHVFIKSADTVCAEGLATRSRELPVCLDDLSRAATTYDAEAAQAGSSSVTRTLAEETRACLGLARSAIGAVAAGDEKNARELTRRLGAHHGSDLRACQTAASANYAVLGECPEL
jgi:hypothetical protein